MSKQFQVEANGTVFGTYEAADAQGARDACAVDAGYKSEADMVEQLDQPSELVATEVSYTTYTLTPQGQRQVASFIASHGKPGLKPEAWFGEAESAADDGFPRGMQAIIEIGGQYSESGRPETLMLDEEWFDATAHADE